MRNRSMLLKTAGKKAGAALLAAAVTAGMLAGCGSEKDMIGGADGPGRIRDTVVPNPRPWSAKKPMAATTEP